MRLRSVAVLYRAHTTTPPRYVTSCCKQSCRTFGILPSAACQPLYTAHRSNECMCVRSVLQPTRGFGDAAYKQMRYWQYRTATQQSNSRANTTPYTPPYTTGATHKTHSNTDLSEPSVMLTSPALTPLCCVSLSPAVCRVSALPDVSSVQLAAGDDFVIVGTDGLFQDMTSQEVVDYAAEYLEQQKQQQSVSLWSKRWPSFMRSQPTTTTTTTPSLSNVTWPSCSTFLLSRALLHASEKHIGRKQSDVDNLLWITQLPLSERRAVHDDCTVVVIHLTHGSTAATQSSDLVPAQSNIQSKL